MSSYCTHHETLVRMVGELRLKGLVFEKDQTENIEKMRQLNDRHEFLLRTFEKAMVDYQNNIKSMLEEFKKDMKNGFV